MNNKLEKQKQTLQELVERFTKDEFFEGDITPLLKQLKTEGNIWVLGAGKATLDLAKQVESHFGSSIKDGVIIVPNRYEKLQRIQVFEGDHPYPGKGSVSSSYELREVAKHIPKEDTVLFLLTGGSSSLFCIPAQGIELEELRETYELLLNSGASIHEINIVRKHLNEVGGGNLAHILNEHRLYSIILSDVPGDDPQVIGSAPTAGDDSSFKQAFHVLKRYELWEAVPHPVRVHITKGMHAEIPENPTPEEISSDHHSIKVIPGAKMLADNVGKYLSQKGYNIQVGEAAYDEEVRTISKKICSDAISILSKKSNVKEPAALIYFGESTVQVSGDGKGGRNQELALSVALSLEGQHPITMLSLATDGVDGPTDAAGAIVNSETTLKARKMKIEPEQFLQKNDSYHFHQKMETSLKIGPTGNNLMDIQVVLIGEND